MDKNAFLKKIEYEDKIVLSNIFEKITLAKKINGTVFSNEFYPPNLWMSIIEMKNELGIDIKAYGMFEDSERRILAFSNEEVEAYPIHLLSIISKSNFSKLEHKDFLGALMALGIKREKFGDLLVRENTAYIPVMQDISGYICDNLTSIGRMPCTLKKIEIEEEKNLNFVFEDLDINVASLRIDDLCGALSHISRSKSVELIKEGKVLLNYKEIREKNVVVRGNSTITIRGIGKFKITEEVAFTSKGRMRVRVKKYV